MTEPVKRRKQSTPATILPPLPELKVNTDTIRVGTYSDLLKEYANLTVCNTNRVPSPTHVKIEGQEDVKDVESEEEEEKTDSEQDSDVEMTGKRSTNKKKKKKVKPGAKRKRNKNKLPNALETRIPYSASIEAGAERLKRHIQQCRMIPAEIEIFNEMKKHVVAPTFVDPCCPNDKQSHEELVTRILNRKAFLHYIDSSLADRCNRQSGEFAISADPRDRHKIRFFPPCYNGVDCEVNKGHIPTEDPEEKGIGFVCSQFMTEEQEALFITNGTRPPSYPCIICCRNQLMRHVPKLRAAQRQEAQGDTVKWPEITNHPQSFLQLFREKREQEGGYLKSCMLIPKPNVYEGFVDPIAKFILCKLLIRKCPVTGRKYLDQNLMKYHPEKHEEPVTGQTMSGFSRGVGSWQTI